MIVVWIVLGVIVLVAIAGVISYNRFVTQKNLIKDAWANIDTELRRRYDLIPNLVETVKGYATHEREVFEEVTRARASAAGATGSPAAQAAAEGPFMAALRQAVRGRRGVSRPEGQPELPGAADRALEHGGPSADRPALLQRERPRVQHALAGVPLIGHRRHVPLRARGVLRDPGRDPGGGRTAGRLLHARRRSGRAAEPAGSGRAGHRGAARASRGAACTAGAPCRLAPSRRAPVHPGPRRPRAEVHRIPPTSWRAGRRS